MAEPFTIYKLTILNMLDKVDFPLTNTQISDFFLEQEYTDYFRVQQVLNDLADSGLIRTESTHSNTQYYITAAGRETLGFFRDKLTDAIEHDTIAYFEKNKMALRTVNSIIADYYKTPNQDYAVRCQFRVHDTNLIDLTLTVKNKEQAGGDLQQLEKTERGCLRISDGHSDAIDTDIFHRQKGVLILWEKVLSNPATCSIRCLPSW